MRIRGKQGVVLLKSEWPAELINPTNRRRKFQEHESAAAVSRAVSTIKEGTSMKRIAIALAGTLALTGVAFAAGDTTKKGGDAAQTGSNATGTTTSGASGSGSGQQMKSDSTGSTGTSAPMKGSPNASGAQMKNDASGSGSMGTGSSTTGTGTSR
ncbi:MULTISPECIES: hypothetical protein [Methylobacteriaceae]